MQHRTSSVHCSYTAAENYNIFHARNPSTWPVQTCSKVLRQPPEPERFLGQPLPGQPLLRQGHGRSLEQQAGHQRPGADQGALLLEPHHQVGHPAHAGLDLGTGLLGEVPARSEPRRKPPQKKKHSETGRWLVRNNIYTFHSVFPDLGMRLYWQRFILPSHSCRTDKGRPKITCMSP